MRQIEQMESEELLAQKKLRTEVIQLEDMLAQVSLQGYIFSTKKNIFFQPLIFILLFLFEYIQIERLLLRLFKIHLKN